MVTLGQIIAKISTTSNYELGLIIKDDIISTDSFGLELNQARFLLEVAERLQGCRCWTREEAVPVEAVRLTEDEDVPAS